MSLSSNSSLEKLEWSLFFGVLLLFFMVLFGVFFNRAVIKAKVDKEIKKTFSLERAPLLELERSKF